MKSEHELRCFCTRAPLLAIYGVDAAGQVYVHVRIYKQRRIFGEMYTTGGVVKLRCRDCLRWHSVLIRQSGKAELSLDKEPPVISARS